MPKIKPLYDKVLVERLQAETRTAGGIVLPDTAKEKPTEGRVVATGGGRMTDDGEQIPCNVSVGDRVLFGSYSGTDIKLEGKEYLIIDAGELLAIVDDKPWAGAARGKSKAKAGASKAGSSKAGASKASSPKSGRSKLAGSKSKGKKRK